MVTKVHREAENLYEQGFKIILIGHANHPEVVGTMGQLPSGAIDLIQNDDEALNYKHSNINKNIAYITQTTLSIDDAKKIIKILKKNFPQ